MNWIDECCLCSENGFGGELRIVFCVVDVDSRVFVCLNSSCVIVFKENVNSATDKTTFKTVAT